MSKLEALDMAYRSGLSQCRLHTIVTTHATFGYLAERYGLKVLPLSGISPDAEPSPRDLAEIADMVRKAGIHYIFFETLVSPKIAETLAHETGAQTLVFNPLEGLTADDRAAEKDYLSIMRENLAHLETALECSAGQP